MDNQKEIEKMASAIYHTGIAIDGTDIAFGLMEDSHFHKIANKLVNSGYGDTKAAVKECTAKVRYETAKEILSKVYELVEEARLESEYKDENGEFVMDEYEFMSKFHFGSFLALAKEYGINFEEEADVEECNKGVTKEQAKMINILTDYYCLGMEIPENYLIQVKEVIPKMKLPTCIFIPMVEWLKDKYGIEFINKNKFKRGV